MMNLAINSPWIKSFLPKALAWLTPRIPELCSQAYLKLGLGVPRWAYKRWLISRFRDMPFIYQDLRLEILNDFVELNLSSLDTSTLNSQQFNTYDMRSATEKMRDYRRGLFLGEGGIGKTTFFRFATLNIMGGATGDRITNQSEKIIPFFVPLKALDNSSDHPLLEALIDCNPYLGKNKSKAIVKLIKLAEFRRAAFFLDGFDEIPYAGGNQSLKQELSALFSPLDEALSGVIGRSKHADFYRAARGCRVYLSSRREFFLAHPISAPRDVPRWAVTGLTDKRSSLVGNIFRHYRKKDEELFASKLNVEEFMRQLSLARDQGFEQLSGNPLFLTVICFVYANEIRTGEKPGEMFKQSSSDLVERCIKLLLAGIDRAKTTGLSDIDARALMNRRSAWSDQKFSALQYSASQMYLQNLGSLSVKSLTNQLLRFFNSNLQISDCESILLGLSKPDPLANMAIQLTLSGVLVVIDRRGQEAIYDFPHRSFKEKLAISYFTTPSGILELTERVNDSSFHELILLVAATPIGWHPIIDAIKSTLRGSADGSLGNLLLQAIERAPTREDATGAAKGLLEMAIRDKGKSICMPKRLQTCLPVSFSYRETLTTILGEITQRGDAWSFALVAEALLAISENRATTMKSIQSMIPNPSDLDWQLLHIASWTEESKDSSELEQCLVWLLSRYSTESADSTITGVFFVGLIGKPLNRTIIRTCLRNWFHSAGDNRSNFFDDDAGFGAVFDIYATTADIQENKARHHFSRGKPPKLQHPWR